LQRELGADLHGPGGGITQGANGVTLNLPAELINHVDLLNAGVSLDEPLEDVVHPPCSLSAGSALTATGNEMIEPENKLDQDLGGKVNEESTSRGGRRSAGEKWP